MRPCTDLRLTVPVPQRIVAWMQAGVAHVLDETAAPTIALQARSNLRLRLLAIGLAPALIILLMAIVAYGALERAFAISSSLTQSRNVISQIVLLRQAVIDEQTAVRGYVLTAHPAFLEPYFAGGAAFDDILATLRPMVADDRAMHEGIEHVSTQHERWRATVAEVEIAAVQRGDFEASPRSSPPSRSAAVLGSGWRRSTDS